MCYYHHVGISAIVRINIIGAYTCILYVCVCLKAAVIEMKSGRSSGPVTQLKRNGRSSASTKTAKTKATTEEMATTVAEGITVAREELESDGDSLSLDSPHDNKSSGDWYWDNSSTYIESDRYGVICVNVRKDGHMYLANCII